MDAAVSASRSLSCPLLLVTFPLEAAALPLPEANCMQSLKMLEDFYYECFYF